ncbi:major facilitator superfamily domain-containing protein [Naematelia encephala]|uniref:Major facilitator superfamily domain-containing protein n=1 Tax=Naematelia encephala TaxID=71784 RepID=A0A1Y2ASN2_9TREE|nr:major facilitator superfamily domain-containing protein [Naematelia encephala]
MASELREDREKGDIVSAPAVVSYVPDEPIVNVKALNEEADRKYDTAAAFFVDLASRPDANDLMAPWTEAEEKAVRRKLDLTVLPMVTLSLFLGGTDKVILGTAATYGLRSDLHLVGQQYSWASSIIFFGSMLTVFPQTWLCQKFPTGKIFAFNVFFFGVMTFATIGAKNAGSLQAIRFILGMFEGMNTSGAGLVIPMWWRKEEQGWRTVLIFNTFSSIANGFLSYCVQFYIPSGGLQRWQLLYLVTGCVSITVGIIDIFCLPANPTKAWWLTDRQKYIATQRLAGNQTGIVNTHTKWSQVKEAVTDVRTWLYFLISLTLNIPNGGLGGFYSIIISGFDFSIKQLALMNIPTGVISYAAALFWVTVAKYTRRPLLCAMASILVCLIGVIVLKVIPHSNIGGSLAALYIIYMYWAPYMVFSQLIMYSNVAGTSKRVGVLGISYWGYCVGNLVGPQSFRSSQAPNYPTAYTVMLVGYCCSLALLSLYGYICWRDNKKKVIQEAQWRESTQGQTADVAEEWKDLTDKENPKFRYTY